MWSKAWVLPRVSLSGLFIYSQNQSLFWRLYLIRLSLSLAGRTAWIYSPFALPHLAPSAPVIQCLSVFPALDELSEENIFFKNLNKVFYMYTCVPACLCVCHIYADACRSQNWYSQAVNCLQQELGTKYEFSAELSLRQGLWVQAHCKSAIFPGLPSKSRFYRHMPLQLPNCWKFLFIIIGQMMWNDRSVSPPSSFSFGFFCDLFLNVIASMWLKPHDVLNALE